MTEFEDENLKNFIELLKTEKVRQIILEIVAESLNDSTFYLKDMIQIKKKSRRDLYLLAWQNNRLGLHLLYLRYHNIFSKQILILD